MEDFSVWIAFIGAWLLFAGPIYQAALELQEQDIELDRIKAAGTTIDRSKPVSPWYWLLPPLKVYLEQKRSKTYRDQYFKALSIEDVEALISFMNKAGAWLIVAAGGLCIALSETYNLSQQSHWSDYIFWVLAVILALASILNVIHSVKRSNQTIENYRSKE
jgi:hypothetical protein